MASAIANATNNFKMDEDKLVVSTIMINEGPVLKELCLEQWEEPILFENQLRILW